MADKDAALLSIEKLRKYALGRGPAGIKTLGKLFRRMDDDGNKALSHEEFVGGLGEYGFHIPIEEANNMCLYFDSNGDGSIDFDEFLINLRPPLSQTRINLIKSAWQKIDVNGDGVLTVADLKGKYNVRQQKAFLSGEKTEDELLKVFLDTFDDDDNGTCTPEEFLNYYSGVSASIDNDLYFDLMMRQAWKL